MAVPLAPASTEVIWRVSSTPAWAVQITAARQMILNMMRIYRRKENVSIEE